MTGKTPPSDSMMLPESIGQRVRIAQAVATVGTVFTIVFLVLLMINGYRQYVTGVREETQLTVQKRQLLQNPDDTVLLERIRYHDRDIRANKLRQLDFAGMGGLMLLISTIITVASIKYGNYLKGIDPQPSEDHGVSFKQRQLGISRMALVLFAFLLASVTFYYGQRVPSDWIAGEDADLLSSDKPDYASPEELIRNWHRFRGFSGAGVTTHSNIPVQWDGVEGSGICWKTKIPLPGHNSPVVWQNRIFLSGATEKKREVYCIDADTGAILWTGEVPTVPTDHGGPEVMEETGFAAPTMATDGVRVYAIFATGDLAAFDFKGNRLWHKNLGTPESIYGYAASLEVWENRVLVQYDQAQAKDGKSRLNAFDGTTGDVVWEVQRPVANSWTSPIIGPVGDGYQLIAVGMPWVIAYDPRDGRTIWQAECLKGDVAASPIFSGDRVIAIEPNVESMAIGTGETGNITDTQIIWRNEDVGPEIVSPVSDDQHVFLMDNYGTLYVVNMTDGKFIYDYDFDEMVNASPSLVDGKLYVLAINGTMFIGRANETEYTPEFENPLGETCYASPAFMPGRIYIRGTEHLYCIGNENS